MPMLEGLDHVALAVRNVARSASWYQDVLGLERLHQEVWGDFPAVVGLGGTAVALFPVRGDPPQPPPGKDVLAMRHLAFRANRVGFEAAKAMLAERGIAYESQDHRIAHSIYFSDPDGHQIEITTYEIGAAG